MTDIVPFDQLLNGAALGGLPEAFTQYENTEDDLSAGVSSGFGVLSLRGKTWRIRYQGEETVIRDAQGNPRTRLPVVIVRANPRVSKTFYMKGYTSGANEAPDCASTDGYAPDPGVPNPQCETCAQCPNNVFGSRVTDDGRKAKACQDNRRLAVVPAHDLKNEVFGGPVLLRIPAASLPNLVQFNQQIKAVGVPYYAVIVELGFDVDKEFPLVTLKPLAVVRDPEVAGVISDLRDSVVSESIVNGMVGTDLPALAGPAQRPAIPHQQPQTVNADPTPAAKPARSRRAAAAPVQAAPPAPEPEPEPEQEEAFSINIGGAKPGAQQAKTPSAAATVSALTAADQVKTLGNNPETALGALLADLPS